MRFGKYLAVILWVGVVAAQIWNEVQRFEAFRAEQPGAGIGAFLMDRGPYFLMVAAVAFGAMALGVWVLRKLPAVDADRTEFHELRDR